MRSISTAHLDYLQRTGIDLAPITTNTPFTSAPAALRRLWCITEVGRVQKQTPSRTENHGQSQSRLPSEDILISAYGLKIPVAFLVRGEPEKVKIYLGTWSPVERSNVSAEVLDERQRILKAALESLYPALSAHAESRGLDDLSHTGIVMGIPTFRTPDPADSILALDRLIRAMSGENWACLILAEPVEENLVSKIRQSIIEEMRTIHAADQARQAPAPLLEHYSELLKIALKTVTYGQSIGMWRTAVYVLGDRRSYYRLASLWKGIYSGEESQLEPIVVREISNAPKLAQQWAMPDTPGPPGPGYYQHLLAYQTLLTSKQLAAYIHLPEQETSGFAVNIVPAFDAVPPLNGTEASLNLGQIVLRARPIEESYNVKSNDLTRHVFVAGVTGAGKTNTVFRLLLQTLNLGVPFLVLEPVKSEYRALLNDPEISKQLQIFTLGDERVSPFRLDPFEVLPGIPVGVHLDLLRSVFSVSMGMWTPLPQVLEQCLHAIYIDRGWDITTNTNHRLDKTSEPWMAFPTLSDLVAKVDKVTSQLGYEDRVTSDIRAALLTRLNALRAGGKGRMLDTRRSLPMQNLLNQPTVLELDGMGDDDDKAFVMGLLLIRLVEHRRIEGKTHKLRHVFVIEEAHRLLTNVSMRTSQEEANPRGKAVETFANLLSEIRAYGQSVIIADQVPVKLAPEVIKNTNLKIAHRVVASDDRVALAGSMAMNEQQAHALAILPRGRAAVFSEGDDAPVLVQIPLAEGTLAQHPPEDGRVEEHMRLIRSESHRNLFQRLPACAETCKDAEAACVLAGRIVEDTAFQRLFARLVLSAIEDTDAVDRLWPEIETLVRSQRPPHIEEKQLLRSIATHASDWFAQKRGAQAGWSYSDTDTLATALRRMILAKLSSVRREDDTRGDFQQLAYRLHKRIFDPYPACSRICRQEPPVCLYRYGAADLITAGDFQEIWKAAETVDLTSEDGNRRQTWEVCMDAGFALIEFADNTWPSSRIEAANEAARRASLCHGQQMAFQEESKMPVIRRTLMDQLIMEAKHE